MDITEIRYRNARYLAESVGGINAVADKLGKSQPQVSHLLADNPVKNIGNKIARQFEVAFNKPKDWLDHSHHELWGGIQPTKQNIDDTAQEVEGLSADALEFARLWQELPPEQRAVLQSTAQAFIHSTEKQTSKIA